MTDNDFDRYVTQYRASVERAALCIVRDAAEAEDIAQETFLRLYTYTGSFENDEHVRAWLLRCAANLGKDALRSLRRRSSVPLSELSELGEKTAPGDSEPFVMPAILTLPPKLRIAMYLHYYEGFTTEETAAILKISASAVKRRLKCGREKLRELIKGEIEDDI